MGKMGRLQITLMKFELMLVFEAHIRKREEAKPYCMVVLCVVNAADH